MTYVGNSWHRAIAHVDGDAFFASVEQAVKPYLKGKPVVTGKERNIVAAASYEAKALGVKRGVALWEARKMCPGLVVLPTDYETVSLFSRRMFDIMRRYSPVVEEYSVDEGFIDLTGLGRNYLSVWRSPQHQEDVDVSPRSASRARGDRPTDQRRVSGYEMMALDLQQEIKRELDITVSVGLSGSKVLAKVASKMKKPAGFARITRHSRAAVLGRLPLVEVWNIGPSTAGLLQAHGLQTALDFANKSLGFVESVLTKPGVEVWRELNGESVWSVQTEAEQAARSISKTRTFTPPTADRDYVYAQLAKNMENACIKARRYRQAPKMVAIFLKRQDYRAFGLESKLVRPTAWPAEMAGVVRELFEKVFEERVKYRATGCILAELTQFEAVQMGLFESKDRIAKLRRLYGAVDEIREKYGKHAVHHAASLLAQGTQHLAARGDMPRRRVELVAGESARRRLPLPMIHTNHT